jgi:ribosome-associated protein
MPEEKNVSDSPEAREDGRPSKSQRKREMTALQDLGAELVELNDNQLAAVDLPENLHDAIVEAKRCRTHEARRRQLQYIGKLMRHIDPAPIRARIEAFKAVGRAHTMRLHQAERWRDRLLDEPEALGEFIATHPGADAQRLRTLVRNAQHERATGQPPRNYRALFRLIRELLDEASAQ